MCAPSPSDSAARNQSNNNAQSNARPKARSEGSGWKKTPKSNADPGKGEQLDGKDPEQQIPNAAAGRCFADQPGNAESDQKDKRILPLPVTTLVVWRNRIQAAPPPPQDRQQSARWHASAMTIALTSAPMTSAGQRAFHANCSQAFSAAASG